MSGSYLPHWGFDDCTTTDYTGQRGDHYYTTETFTNNQGRTETRQVRQVRWEPAAGEIDHLGVGAHMRPHRFR